MSANLFTERLIPLSRAGLERTKKLYFAADFCVMIALILGLLSRFEVEVYLVSSPAFLVVLSVFAIFLRIKGSELRSISRRARYTGLLCAAYGRDVDSSFTGVAGLNFGRDFLNQATAQYGSEQFYEMAAESPRERLREMLVESAFWSSHLYAMAARLAIAIVCVMAISVLVFLEWLADSPGLNSGVLFSQVILIMVSIIFGYDLVRRLVGWSGASKETSSILNDLRMVDIGKEEELMLQFVRYQLTVYSAPLLPSLVYALKKEEIRAAWAEYQSNCRISAPDRE